MKRKQAGRVFKKRSDRLILFFMSLGAALFILDVASPAIRHRTVSVISTLNFFKKSSPKDYLAEQLEMEKARLKAALDQAALPRPNLPSHFANVIFRDPLQPHTLWIDAGYENCPFIAKRSPLCIGPHAIGIVESVEKKRSKVRLLSDPQLHPHVHAANGGTKTALANHHITELKALFTDAASQSAIGLLEKKISQRRPDIREGAAYLCGFGKGNLFEGKGFVLSEEKIKKGDLLVTSGLDGVFPPGLFVARVAEVMEMERGALSYRLTARSTYPYHQLSALFVLPPISEEPDF